MKIALLKEAACGETRTALVPDAAKQLVETGHKVVVETSAGTNAGFSDDDYRNAGAETVPDPKEILKGAELLASVQAPNDSIVKLLDEGTSLVGLLRPNSNSELLNSLARRGVNAFSMELVPRVARAQRLDVLSSQSSLAGCKAVLIAANTLGKLLPMMMTAAGTIPPSRVLVLGAGVAGLQAIATARRLGAVVEAFDVRAATREQVESLGATFLEIDQSQDVETIGGYAQELNDDEQERQRDLIATRATVTDAVITTALIPNRPSPLLITSNAVVGMNAGSVIVDLAAEAGGNCELSEPGSTVIKHEVVIHAPLNVPSMMPLHASQMYSRNLMALFELLFDESGQIKINFSDQIVRETCVTYEGKIIFGNQDLLTQPEEPK